MIDLTIEGRHVSAAEGESLLSLARREGFEIPSLCYHDLLPPYGACRVCLVEVKKGGRAPRLTTACNYPALDGIEVFLDTERVQKARRLALELLLAHAPEAPAVVDLSARYGVTKSRFGVVPEPVDCVLCGLCADVCRHIVGASAITLAGRGLGRRVEPPYDDPTSCIGCGCCESLCPTGVLRMQQLAIERLRELPGPDRPCRYSLMGLLPGALCANDFRCERCETEQAMTARYDEHPLLALERARSSS